jgi:hypothetical protein
VPPDNQTPELALAITTLPYSVTLDVSGVPSESDYIPECIDDIYEPLWWKYTPPPGVTVIGLTYGAVVEADYFPNLSMWVGAPGSLTQLFGRCVFAGTMGYVTFNVTPGVTYYLLMVNDNDDGGVPGSDVVFSVERPPNVDAPAGSLVVANDVPGFPAVVIARDGSIAQVIGLPSFEMAAWLPDGTLAVVAEPDNSAVFADSLHLYDGLTLRESVSGVFTSGVSSSVSPITSNGLDTFYVVDVVDVGSTATLRTISAAGVLDGSPVDIGTALRIPAAIGVNADETVLYVSRAKRNSPAQTLALARWDLVNQVALSNLVTPIEGVYSSVGRDLLVMGDGSILWPLSVAADHLWRVLRYSDAGVLLNTYVLNSGVFGLPRISRDPDDAAVFWAMGWPGGTNTGDEVVFEQIRLNDGVVLDTVRQTIKHGEDGNPPLYGPANSCPLLLAPVALAGAHDVPPIELPPLPLPTPEAPTMPCEPTSQTTNGGTNQAGCNTGGVGIERPSCS